MVFFNETMINIDIKKTRTVIEVIKIVLVLLSILP